MPKIKQAAEEMLLQTIIPFWKGMRDEENGGFYGYMDFDLKLDKQAEKGCILNSRILWFFSEAAMLTGRADPLGGLVVSVPKSAGAMPFYYNHKLKSGVDLSGDTSTMNSVLLYCSYTDTTWT